MITLKISNSDEHEMVRVKKKRDPRAAEQSLPIPYDTEKQKIKAKNANIYRHLLMWFFFVDKIE